MLPRTTPWAVAFAFVLIVATAGAATQKGGVFASVGTGLDLAGSEASAEAEVHAEVEVRAPRTLPSLPELPARGSEDDGSRSPSSPARGNQSQPPSNASQPPSNGTSSSPAPVPTSPSSPPSNGTGTGGNGTAPPAPAVPQKAPELTPEQQRATGTTRTTMHFQFSVTNPDAKEQRVKINVAEPAGWSIVLSEREPLLEAGETRVIDGRALTMVSSGGQATIHIYALGTDGRDSAKVYLCARGIFVDMCEPVVSTGSHGNGTSPPSNQTQPPPSNETQPPPSNQTTTPSNQTQPPSNQTQPPSNSSDPSPPANSTGPASPAPTPPPQNPPPPPPSNQTSSAPASPPPSEEDEGDGFWVDAEVGAEGEASSDGLRVEV